MPRGKLSGVVPVVPTARREFAAGEQAGAFVRVCQGGHRPLAPVVILAGVVDGQDAEVFSTAETFEPDRFGTTRAANFSVSLPPARLAKGAYLLTITVTRGSTTVRRAVRFARQ